MSCEVKGNSMCRLYYQLQFLILHGSELRDRKIERERERERKYSAGVDMLKELVLSMQELKVKMSEGIENSKWSEHYKRSSTTKVPHRMTLQHCFCKFSSYN